MCVCVGGGYFSVLVVVVAVSSQFICGVEGGGQVSVHVCVGGMYVSVCGVGGGCFRSVYLCGGGWRVKSVYLCV